jgi:hypothetical protein
MPSTKTPYRKMRFRIYMAGTLGDSACHAVDVGRPWFGFLQYAGHVRPE